MICADMNAEDKRTLVKVLREEEGLAVLPIGGRIAFSTPTRRNRTFEGHDRMVAALLLTIG